jgi:hypothetical protein
MMATSTRTGAATVPHTIQLPRSGLRVRAGIAPAVQARLDGFLHTSGVVSRECAFALEDEKGGSYHVKARVDLGSAREKAWHEVNGTRAYVPHLQVTYCTRTSPLTSASFTVGGAHQLTDAEIGQVLDGGPLPHTLLAWLAAQLGTAVPVLSGLTPAKLAAAHVVG